MKVVAVITDPSEVNKILEWLKRNNAPPFDKVEIKASYVVNQIFLLKN